MLLTQEDKSEKPSGFSLPDQRDEVTPQNLIFPQIAPLISAEFPATITVTLKSEEEEIKSTKATSFCYAGYSAETVAFFSALCPFEDGLLSSEGSAWSAEKIKKRF